MAALAAVLAGIWARPLIDFLYKYKLWRKTARDKTITGEAAPVFNKLHQEREVTVPRFGGLLIWVTTIILVILFFGISKTSNIWWVRRLNFLSRGQTWLPLFALISASLLGLTDDILQVFGKGKYVAGGLRFTRRLLVVILIGIIGALWFYFKLDWHTIHVPMVGNFEIGLWYLPLFVLVVLACWSGGVIDGIDGLAGGVFAIIYIAFSVIAFSSHQFDLATFCAIIGGTLFAFLWFNIPPAKFYMGETGTLGLTVTLAVISFLTNSVLVLPIIGGLLVIESGSVILQLLSKKYRHKKIWLCTPIHHHLEAKGWPPYQITMRMWLLGILFAIVGVAIRLLG